MAEGQHASLEQGVLPGMADVADPPQLRCCWAAMRPPGPLHFAATPPPARAPPVPRWEGRIRAACACTHETAHHSRRALPPSAAHVEADARRLKPGDEAQQAGALVRIRAVVATTVVAVAARPVCGGPGLNGPARQLRVRHTQPLAPCPPSPTHMAGSGKKSTSAGELPGAATPLPPPAPAAASCASSSATRLRRPRTSSTTDRQLPILAIAAGSTGSRRHATANLAAAAATCMPGAPKGCAHGRGHEGFARLFQGRPPASMGGAGPGCGACSSVRRSVQSDCTGCLCAQQPPRAQASWHVTSARTQ
jgi:hypothetical protein